MADTNTIEIRYAASDGGASAVTNAVRSAIEQLQRATEQATSGFGAAGSQGAQLQQHLASIGEQAQQSSGHVSLFGKLFDGFGSYVDQVAHLTAVVGGMRVALSLLTSGGGALKSTLIDFNDQLQQATIGFTQMLGSGQQADAFLRQLQQFANTTPFKFEELVQASQHMLAFGFSAQQVKPLLEAVGNTAAAMGAGDEGINRLTLALGQMQAKGKVSGDELLQLQEAGIKTSDVFDIIAQQTGKTSDQIQTMASKGKLSSQDFIAAFEVYTNRFNGMMTAQGQTFSGAMSTIQDSLQSAGARAFKPFFDLISEGMIKFAAFLQTDKFSNFVDTVGSAMDKVGASIRKFFDMFKEFTPKEVFGQVVEGFQNAVDAILKIGQGGEADAAGQNLMVEFAGGLIKGANGAVNAAVDGIAQSIADFFVGHSPPPKGPLNTIDLAGEKLMQTYTEGMARGAKAAEDVAASLSGTLNAGADPTAWNAISASLQTGAMSMQQLDAAAASTSEHVTQLGLVIGQMTDAQSQLKMQIDDITQSYQDQIDPLQKQLDLQQQQVDWEQRKKDLALQYSDVLIQQMEQGDAQLNGLQDSLKSLEDRQKDLNAPKMADRTTENTIRTLQNQLNNLTFTPKALPTAPVVPEAPVAPTAPQSPITPMAPTAPQAPQGPILAPGQQLTQAQSDQAAQDKYQYQLANQTYQQQKAAYDAQVAQGQDQYKQQEIIYRQKKDAYDQEKAHYDDTVKQQKAAYDAQVKAVNDENTARQKQIDAQKKAIQDRITGIQETQRKQQEADEDARKALEIQIYNVQKQIEERKKYFEQQLDANKKTEDANALEEKRKSILQQITNLPLQKQIADLKLEEEKAIEPLQHQYDLNQRIIDQLNVQRSHWQLLAGDIDAIKKPLDEAAAAMDQINAKAESAAEAAAKKAEADAKKAAGGAANAPTLQLKLEDFNKMTESATDATKKAAPDFEKVGENIGQSITEGVKTYIEKNFGRIIFGAIGGALGDALLGEMLGPVGVILGTILGARFGDTLQKKVEDLPWDTWLAAARPKIDTAAESFKIFFGVLTGSWGPSITGVVEGMGGIEGAAAKMADTIRNKLIPGVESFGRWIVDTGIPSVKNFIAAIIPTLVDAVVAISDWVTRDGMPALKTLSTWFAEIGLQALRGVESFVKQTLVPTFNTISNWITGDGMSAFTTLSNFVRQDVIPNLQSLGTFISTEVVPALNTMWRLISETLMPALTAWWGFLSTRVLPILVDWWKLILNTLVPALTTLWNFIDKNIVPVLRTMVSIYETNVLPAMKAVADFIAGTLLQALTSLHNFINDHMQPVLNVLGTFFEKTLSPELAAAKVAIDLLLEGFKTFSSWIDTAWSVVGPKLSGPFNDVKRTFSAFMTDLGVGIEHIGNFFDIANLTKAGQNLQDQFRSGGTALNSPVSPGGGGGTPRATGDMNFGGGMALIGEAGRELYHDGGGWKMAGQPTLLELPAGATVLPNAVTEQLLKMGVPGFAGGLLGEAAGKVGNVAGDALDLVRAGAQAVYDKTVGALPDLSLPGAFAEVGRAVTSKVKDGLMDLIKGLLPDVKGLISNALQIGSFGGNATPGSGNWHNPVPGYRAVQGSWTHGGTHDNEAAVDWATPLGTNILAPDSGFAGTVMNGDGATGRTGIIDHGNGWITYFGHVRDFAFGGVKQDNVVGHTGSPEEDGGAGSGAHLHFAMRLHGAYERPEDYIPGIFGLAAGGVTQDEGVYYLHPKEAVIPLDSQKGQELTGGGGSGTQIVFQPGSIVVQGSVVSENDLVETVHQGLQRLDRRGALLIGQKK